MVIRNQDLIFDLSYSIGFSGLIWSSNGLGIVLLKPTYSLPFCTTVAPFASVNLACPPFFLSRRFRQVLFLRIRLFRVRFIYNIPIFFHPLCLNYIMRRIVSATSSSVVDKVKPENYKNYFEYAYGTTNRTPLYTRKPSTRIFYSKKSRDKPMTESFYTF